MNNYDFSQINDKRFEMLTCDLLSIYFHERIERFKPGKDKGIDGRFFSTDGGQTVIQCKHYLGSGYKNMLSNLRKKELKKVIKLKPKRYVLATTLPLSVSNKREILNIFHPYIKREDDIFGKEDLNDLLSQNSEIEEKYIELWIGGSNVLKKMLGKIINNDLEGRSIDKIEGMFKNAKMFVKTKKYNEALKHIKKKRVLVITGEPGIGKTTLAENLCLNFILKEYKFYEIEEDPTEAEKVFVKGKKQIFYFDDFLGAYYFEVIEGKRDSHIMNFIDRVSRDKSKIFILTSRTNILNIGVEFSVRLDNKNILKNEFLLAIDDLTNMEKALILYNHIWFSKLKKRYINVLYKERFYMDIIKHDNFNPRLIESITDADPFGVDIKSADYFSYIKEELDNPSAIWGKCLKVQSNDYIRNLVCLVVFNGGKISEIELEKSFVKMNKLENLSNNSNTEKGFKSIVRLATKIFLSRTKNSAEVIYTLYNPSIGDYIVNEYGESVEKLTNIFISLNSIKSLEQLTSLSFQNLIIPKASSEIKNNLFRSVLKESGDYDYMLHLLGGVMTNKEAAIDLLNRIETNPKPIQEVKYLFELLKEYNGDLEFTDFSFLLTCIDEKNFSEGEIMDFADFVEYFEIDNEGVLNMLQLNLESFLSDELYLEKDSIDLSDIVEVTYQNGVRETEYDPSVIEWELEKIVEEKVDELESKIISKLSPRACRDAVKEIWIDGMVSDYVNTLDEDYGKDYRDDYGYHEQDNSDSAIYDLFEKT